MNLISLDLLITKVNRINCLGDMNVCTKFYLADVGIFHKISVDVVPACGAGGKVRGPPKSLGSILWVPRLVFKVPVAQWLRCISYNCKVLCLILTFYNACLCQEMGRD